ncbi:glycosyltransferase family 4 protein [Pseudoalteromonas sp. 2CM28B]|uniref:glycosyltransferase family 4 protein n=1 Tax=Pseudoalteromonas sp. 2CM28B TaxID=2929851 RepID=UPI0020C10520|nr:glycosyltransferase family 4 protein [Pseudoalteromonas sp. 2CM28B]MCK8137770.1 glycosyltransferase family 4 protein [Pseudoalteromonas sp. 2CM28B]
MKIINYVVGKDNKSKIFFDIFTRLSNYLSLNYSNEYYLVVTELPIEGASLYHYHRPQFNGVTHHPSVVTVHHDLEDTDLSLDKNIFLDEYKRADLVMCLNTNQAQYLKDHGVNNTCIIPHGYDKRLVDYQDKPKDKKKLTIGFISKRYGRRVKGEVYLNDLMKFVDPEYVDFIFVGAGRREEAMLARSLGFDVKCYEYLPYSTLLTLYPQIDYLLMCSDSEGGPANIPEALASKTPVLGFNIGLVTDLVKHNENGFLLTKDAKVDGEFIDVLSKNKELTKALNKAWFISPSLITWEEVFERKLSYYEEVINKGVLHEPEEVEVINVPFQNVRMDYQLPKVIKAEELTTINISIINDECHYSKEIITNSNMYIAIKVDGGLEVYRQRVNHDLNIGLTVLKFSFLLSKELSNQGFTIDLLCDHLGWFNLSSKCEVINII